MTATVTPTANHIGFADVVHGGFIATVADEVMVWAATWAGRRFCYCGELSVRFRRPARPGVQLRFEGKVETRRNRLIASSFRCVDEDGDELSNGYAKYVPLSMEEHTRMVDTFVDDPDSKAAAGMLVGSA